MIIYAGKLHPSGISDEVSFRDGGITPISPFVSVVSAPRNPSRDGDNFAFWYAGKRLPLNIDTLRFGEGMILPQAQDFTQGVPDDVENTNEIEDAQAYVDLAENAENSNEIEEPLAGFYEYATVDNIENSNEVTDLVYHPVQIIDRSQSVEFQRLNADTLTLFGEVFGETLTGENNYSVNWIAGSKGRLFVAYSNYPHDGDDEEGYLEVDPNTLEVISNVWTQDGPSLISQFQIAVTSNDRIFVYRQNTIVEVDPDSSFDQVGSSWDPSGTHGSIECIYAYGELLFIVGATDIGVYKTNGLTIGSFTLLDTISLPTWITSDAVYSMSVSGFRGFAFKISGGAEVTEFDPLTVEQIGDWETSSTSYRGIGGQNLSSDISLAIASDPEDVQSTNEVEEPDAELFGATAVNIENANIVEEPTLINLLDIQNTNEVEEPSAYGKLSVDLENANEVGTLVFVHVDNLNNDNEVEVSSLGYYINNAQNTNEVEEVSVGLLAGGDPFEMNLNLQNLNFIDSPLPVLVPQISSVDNVSNENSVSTGTVVDETFHYGKIRFTRKEINISNPQVIN